MEKNTQQLIRVRFAPSPTGWLHLGGARTALINYLFAKNQKGTFVLRVEDTDIKRGDNSFLQGQLNALKWMGLHWDEGPYFQSKRLKIYQDLIDKLIQKNLAYYCFLTEKDLEIQKQKAPKSPFRSPFREISNAQAQQKIKQGEKAVVRFKTPLQKKFYKLNDLVRGTLTFPSDMVGDFILLRASQLPVYNFACAVDDYMMRISHVFRSEEHLPNTLRQMMIFEAFNWPYPQYGHLSIILGEDRKKLSKRHGAVSVEEYQKQAYLPSALTNFLALMGWNPKTQQEIFSPTELIKAFSVKGLNAAPGLFDKQKLNWVNSQHLKKLTDKELWDMLQPGFEKQGLKFPLSPAWRKKTFLAVRSSFTSLPEALDIFQQLSEKHFTIQDSAKEVLSWPATQKVLNGWKSFLNSVADSEEFITLDQFSKALKEIQKTSNTKGKLLFMPLRVAILGSPEGMELKAVIPLITRPTLLKRVSLVLESM